MKADLALASSTASAQVTEWDVSGNVPDGLAPNDLHLFIGGTGGSITNPSVVPAGAAVSPNGNNIDIIWPTDLAAGAVVTITFRTAQPLPIVVNTWNWTKDGATIGTPNQGSFLARPLPAWYSAASRRGFAPNVFDFYQHQNLIPNHATNPPQPPPVRATQTGKTAAASAISPPLRTRRRSGGNRIPTEVVDVTDAFVG